MTRTHAMAVDELADDAELTIVGRTVQLTVPRSLAERYDVVTCAGDDMTVQRVSALGLGLCWMWLRRRLARKGIAYRGNPATFGGKVLDTLLEEGAEIHSIVRAGQQAVQLCAVDLPGIKVPANAAQAAEVVGNDGPTEE